MVNLQAIAKTEFANKSWQRNPNFLFSAKDAVCPLSSSEIPRAMMGMPLAFLCANGEYSLVAILGLEQGANFFIDATGQWLGNYIPAAYRGYPFVLARNETEEEQLVLCIDKDSGLLNEDDSGEPFFDKNGEPTPTITELIEFLSDLRKGLQASALICKTLLEHELFKPWELQFELEDGTKRIEGLFCIDEAALNKLSDKAFVELRLSGAFPLIYCQLLSMQRISDLTRFAQSKSKANSASLANELDLDGVNMSDNISFENL